MLSPFSRDCGIRAGFSLVIPIPQSRERDLLDPLRVNSAKQLV
jgi:hypothetical protein